MPVPGYSLALAWLVVGIPDPTSNSNRLDRETVLEKADEGIEKETESGKTRLYTVRV
jgi:hypothetical protein